MEHAPMNARRTRAAAWAWYQRGSGSPGALASARSEAAARASSAPHRSKFQSHGPPSRFKLEADLLLSTGHINEASDRLECLHLHPDSSIASSSESDSVMLSSDMLVPMPRLNPMSPHRPLASSADDLVIAVSSSSYGTASWDCGSALFDSFELVTMSKKLDDAHQLHKGMMEKVSPPVEDMSLIGSSACEAGIEAADDEEDEVEGETNTGLLHSRQSQTGNDLGEFEAEGHSNGAPQSCKQSRQAIYDMLCRYDKTTLPAGGLACEDEPAMKKHSTSVMQVPSACSSKQYRRKRRLQSLSRAFRQQFVQLTGQFQKPSASIAPHQQQPNVVCIQQSSSLPAPHRSCHKSRYGQAGSSCAGIDLTKSDQGLGFQASSLNLRKQYCTNGVQHHHHHYHHHHHHHFLLPTHQSDADGFGVLPILPILGADKSHLVAAAGLRTSKVSSLQDYNFLLNSTLLDLKHGRGEPNVNDVASTTTDVKLP